MIAHSAALRYTIVALVCAAAHNAILLVGDLQHIHYAVSCVISYAIVVVLGFVLHAWFTFGLAPTLASFTRYALGMAANYPLALVLLFLLHDLGRLPMTVSAPAATVLQFGWNYAATRWAILRRGAELPATPSERP